MQIGGEAKSTKQREIGSRYMEMKSGGEKDECRWKMAEGQHTDCPGPDWHLLGRLTDRERKREGKREYGARES